MKKFLCVLLLMFVASSVHAAPQGFVEEVFIDESVATENTITSAVFPVKSSGYFGCWMKAATPTGQAGTSNLNAWVEMSYDATSDNFAKPDGMANLLTAHTSTSPTVFSISPSPMPYMRIKVDGVKGTISGGNTTGTTVTMYLFRQE